MHVGFALLTHVRQHPANRDINHYLVRSSIMRCKESRYTLTRIKFVSTSRTYARRWMFPILTFLRPSS